MATLFKQKPVHIVAVSIILGGFIVGISFWLAYGVFDVDSAGGPPAHGRYGTAYYCCGYGNSCTTSSCDSWDIAHIQGDLNFLHQSLDSYSIPSGYPLSNTTVYSGGKYDTATRNAVSALQNWYKTYLDSQALVTGNFFNQTTTYAHLIVAQTEAEPVRHPAGVGIRYPVYGNCWLVTNNNSLPMAVPFNTSAEWSAYVNNAPNATKNSSVDCGPTAPSGGGGGGGGGTSSTTYGTRITCKCGGGSYKYQCHTADSNTICNSLCFPESYVVIGKSCSSLCNNSGC